MRPVFKLDANLGTISTIGDLNHEESRFYEMERQAMDKTGYSAGTKVLITILDVNDNAPEIVVTSLSLQLHSGKLSQRDINCPFKCK